MALALLSASFQSLPPLPTSTLGPSGADSQVGGFVYIRGPRGVCLTSQLFLPVYLHMNVGLLGLSAASSLGPPAAALP